MLTMYRRDTRYIVLISVKTSLKLKQLDVRLLTFIDAVISLFQPVWTLTLSSLGFVFVFSGRGERGIPLTIHNDIYKNWLPWQH